MAEDKYVPTHADGWIKDVGLEHTLAEALRLGNLVTHEGGVTTIWFADQSRVVYTMTTLPPAVEAGKDTRQAQYEAKRAARRSEVGQVSND